jgi:hypothetical protein
MALGFPWYRGIDSYIIKELNARKNPQTVSGMVPWIHVTSNLGGQKTISSGTYADIIGDSYKLDKEYGFRPSPIITDFSVDFSQRGTLRAGTIKIKCFTVEQYTDILKYFLEPGISVFIQWGWNKTASDGRTVYAIAANSGNVNGYNRNPDLLNTIRASANGCYDNMVGIITGGDSSIDGENFEVQCKVTTIGEVLFNYNQEVVTSDAEKPKPIAYQLTDASGNAISGPKLNWYYCFNQLPDEVRNTGVQSLEATFGKKNYNEFIHFMEDVMEEAKTETAKNGWFTGDITYKGATFEALDSESPVTPKKYISFNAFIEILNQSRVQISGGAADFKVNITDTYISCFPGIWSTDDRIFIPNKECYNYIGEQEYFVKAGGKVGGTMDTSVGGISFPGVDGAVTGTTVTKGSETITLAANTFGDIRWVFLDSEVVAEALRNQTKPIKEILDGVLDVMAEAVEGLWSFQLIENHGELKIVDSNLRNTEKDNVHTFSLSGTDSVFLTAKFGMDISKATQSKIYMEKSTGLKNPNELTGLFSNQIDSILKRPTVTTPTQTPQAGSELTDAKKQGWIDFRRNVRLAVNPSQTGTWDIGDGNLDEWAVPVAGLNKKSFIDQLKTYITSFGVAYTGRTLPVEFSFTVLGISGFKVGHMYRVTGLPDQYNNKGAFQVEEIKHAIDAAKWTTEVIGHYRPFSK